MKKRSIALCIAVLLLSLLSLSKSFSAIQLGANFFLIFAPLITGATGIAAIVFLLKKKEICISLLYAWFALQFLDVAIREFAPAREAFLEIPIYQPAGVKLGFGMGWWINEASGKMLYIQLNLLFIALAYFFEQYVKPIYKTKTQQAEMSN